MKTNYNIKNFRVFGEEGAEARLHHSLSLLDAIVPVRAV